MSRRKRKNRDYLPFTEVKLTSYERVGHPLFTDEEILEMNLAKKLGKIIVPKRYDVAFTYSMTKPYADSKEEAKRFADLSEKFEKAVVDLLSEIMDYCSHVDMEVEGK